MVGVCVEEVHFLHSVFVLHNITLKIKLKFCGRFVDNFVVGCHSEFVYCFSENANGTIED